MLSLRDGCVPSLAGRRVKVSLVWLLGRSCLKRTMCLPQALGSVQDGYAGWGRVSCTVVMSA